MTKPGATRGGFAALPACSVIPTAGMASVQTCLAFVPRSTNLCGDGAICPSEQGPGDVSAVPPCGGWGRALSPTRVGTALSQQGIFPDPRFSQDTARQPSLVHKAHWKSCAGLSQQRECPWEWGTARGAAEPGPVCLESDASEDGQAAEWQGRAKLEQGEGKREKGKKEKEKGKRKMGKRKKKSKKKKGKIKGKIK